MKSLNTAVLRILKILSMLILIWGVLAENAGWGFGLEAIIVATLATLLFVPLMPERWNVLGLIVFSSYFIIGSIRGGIDVAKQAFKPKLELRPGWINYPLRLPPGQPRVLFLNTVSLLPGTLSVDLHDDQALIHALVDHPDQINELARLEQRVAKLFALTLGEPAAPKPDRNKNRKRETLTSEDLLYG